MTIDKWKLYYEKLESEEPLDILRAHILRIRRKAAK